MGKEKNHNITYLSPNLKTAIGQIQRASRPLDKDHLSSSMELLNLWTTKQLIGNGSALLSVLRTAVYSSTVYADTDWVPTAAVTMPGEIPILTINPKFFHELSPDQAGFVISHEMYHLVLGHLNSHQNFMMSNKKLATVAREAMINRLIMRQNRKGIPEKQGVTISMVNPDQLYALYVKTANSYGVKPVSEVSFFTSELSIYTSISDLPKPMDLPDPKCDTATIEQDQNHSQQECPNCQGQSKSSKDETSDDSSDENGSGSSDQDDDSSDENGSGSSDRDDDSDLNGNDYGSCSCHCHSSNGGAKGSLVERALSKLAEQARNGSGEAKEIAQELIENLQKASPESKIWGNIAAGVGVGTTTEVKKTAMWEKAVAHLAATILSRNASRLVYDRKSGAVGPRLARKGLEKTKKGFFFADTSGSMYGGPIERLIQLIGSENQMEILYRTFDTDVYEHEIGQTLIGGGGTDFSVIQQYLDDQAHAVDGIEDPDFILVFTDGYAEPFVPAEPEKWVVVLTPNGTESWPQKANLAYYRLDETRDELS
jgi:predicted metal-dependent peptidase